MKKNMGNLDRGIRIVVAIIFAALIVTGTVSELELAGMLKLTVGGVVSDGEQAESLSP